jgi:hypothetical protein
MKKGCIYMEWSKKIILQHIGYEKVKDECAFIYVISILSQLTHSNWEQREIEIEERKIKFKISLSGSVCF